MITRSTIGLAAVGCCFISPPDGRTADQVFSARTDLVRVDVLATRDGRPVEDLDLTDFDVFDNGVRQHIQFVTLGDLATHAVLLLDSSISVQGKRFEQLQLAIAAVLSDLRPTDRASLLTFSHVLTRSQTSGVGGSGVASLLDTLRPGGGTALFDATYAGMLLAESGADQARALVILFSDGADTGSALRAGTVLDAASRLGTVVYAVVPPGIPPRRFVQTLTRDTGGRIVNVTADEGVGAVFATVFAEFRQRYVIGFVPTGVESSGRHLLKVTVKRNGTEVRHRAAYVR